MKNEALTTPAVRNMVRPWLTGSDEEDAISLKRAFRMLHFSVAQWRQIITEVKSY